jgi:hypothetical protein
MTRAQAAAAAAAAEAKPVPAALLRGRQLAAWLAKRRGSVRSLRIPLRISDGSSDSGSDEGSDDEWDAPAVRGGWAEDLTLISKALTAPQRAAAAGPPLPHLVQLELPVLGLPGTAAMLKDLAGCTGLQWLVLEPPYRMQHSPISLEQLGAALTPFTQLRTLHIEWPCYEKVEGSCMAAFLQQLPPSLEEVQLKPLYCRESDSIPLSCMNHLVRLKAWELWTVRLVEDDLSSSSSSGSSSGGTGHGAAALTALTSLKCSRRLEGSDARLQAPNLRALTFGVGMGRPPAPETWALLPGMSSLRQLTMGLQLTMRVPPELGRLSQLQDLQFVENSLPPPVWLNLSPPAVKPWAVAVACLTQLRALRLPAMVVMAGGPTLLTPLTQLQQLGVETRAPCTDAGLLALPPGFIPSQASGWAATQAGAVVQVVAAAVAAGWRPLQRLVLWDRSLDEDEKVMEARAAAGAALPGVEVEVKVWW